MRGMKGGRIPSLEMTVPRREAGINQRPNPCNQSLAGLGGHSGTVLPPGGDREHCSNEPG